jgi:ferredoxin
MAFKNPANISSLDDETYTKVALQGVYYSDTRTRYSEIAAVVRCDKCGLCPLACSTVLS